VSTGKVNQEIFYNDGITKVTDPFWTVKCPDCGYDGWSLTYMDGCPICSSPDAVYTNPTIKKPALSPKRAGKSAETLTKTPT
jgi:hypothetical protein